MCARYRLKRCLGRVADVLGIDPGFEEFSQRPRLNIAISQRVPIVISKNGKATLAGAQWGFLAPWDKSKRIFNAAAETISLKPTFRESFAKRRCLIPADGFYEWPNKQATLIRFADDRVFCFAGLWLDDTMTMVTTAPNDFMRPIHHRMPAILREGQYAAWLDAAAPRKALEEIIAPRPWEGMQTEAVGKLSADEPENIRPLNSD